MGRQRMRCNAEGVRDTVPWRYGGVDVPIESINRFNYGYAEDNLSIEVIENSEWKMVLYIQGIDVSFVNGMRRVLMNSVPSVAPETLHIYQNTGVIPDEVLSHRIGLVPFKIDADRIRYRSANEDISDKNALKFRIKTGLINRDMLPMIPGTDEREVSYPIYSRDMVWVPMSDAQEQEWKDDPPRPVYPDILITRLGPANELEIEFWIEKGKGGVHAKWNPVCPATYKFEPVLTVDNSKLTEQEVEDLVELCPVNVFEASDGKINVSNAWNCTTCRACIEKHPEAVILEKKRESYLFTIESTGVMPPARLWELACKSLIATADKNLAVLDQM